MTEEGTLPTPPVTTPPAIETKPDDSVVIPPTQSQKAEAAPDLEKIESSITEKVSKSLIERIGTALGMTKEEKKQIPTDPDELRAFVREESKRGTQEILSEREKADQKAQEEREQQITEGATRFQTLWKNQYNELAESGRVPKILKPEDKNDPGNIAKVKILTKLSQIIKENEANGIDYVPTLKEVFYENPNLLRTDTIAGATTPVAGRGRSVAPGEVLPYDRLHKTNLEDIVKEKYN